MKITDFKSVVNHSENHNETKIKENLEARTMKKLFLHSVLKYGGGGDFGATPLVYKHAR